MAWPLGLCSKPANAGAGGMNADFCGIEHRDSEDIAIARGAGAHDLSEERNANTHQLARVAAPERRLLCLLLLAQLLIVDRFHRLGHGGVVVAGIVLPAHGRSVWELLTPDQVL